MLLMQIIIMITIMIANERYGELCQCCENGCNMSNNNKKKIDKTCDEN